MASAVRPFEPSSEPEYRGRRPYRRYAIVDEAMLKEGAAKLQIVPAESPGLDDASVSASSGLSR